MATDEVIVNVCGGVFAFIFIAIIVMLIRRVQEKEKLRKHKYGEVITFSNALTSLNNILRGGWQQLRGNISGALESYNIAIAHNPNNKPAYYSRGCILTKLNQNEEALADFDIALEVMPNHDQALSERGRVYMNLGEFVPALADFNEAIALKPKRLDTYMYRAIAYGSLKQYQDALTDIEYIIQRAPQKYIGYVLRGALYFQQENYEAAIQDLQKAHQLNPNDSLTLQYLANYDLAMHKWDVALERCQNFIQHHQKPDPTWYMMRATAYRRLGQFNKSLEDSDTFLHLKPDVAVGYNNRAWLKAAMGDYITGLEDANHAIQLDTSVAIYFGTHGTLKWLVGDYEAALSDFNYAYKLDNKHAAFINERAVALFSLGRTDEAIAAWQQIQARDDGLTTAEALQEEYGYPQPFYEVMQQVEALAKGE